jgi:hypothetical protein
LPTCRSSIVGWSQGMPFCHDVVLAAVVGDAMRWAFGSSSFISDRLMVATVCLNHQIQESTVSRTNFAGTVCPSHKVYHFCVCYLVLRMIGSHVTKFDSGSTSLFPELSIQPKGLEHCHQIREEKEVSACIWRQPASVHFIHQLHLQRKSNLSSCLVIKVSSVPPSTRQRINRQITDSHHMSSEHLVPVF